MLGTRIIPCLQLIDRSLVKTVRFKHPAYIGDPVNTVRIFNELEVDELCFLDIRASLEKRGPDIGLLREIADECFMPLSYGGGIRDLATVQQILSLGFEKVVLNTMAYYDPGLVSAIADKFGNQSLVGSIDVKRDFFGRPKVHVRCGSEKVSMAPVDYAQRLVELGVGELLVTSMDRDGTWAGFDVDITAQISDAVRVPVIANGGAGSVKDVQTALSDGKAHAVALGSLVVYQKKGMGVLVNMPFTNYQIQLT
jgi:cyclase